MCQRARLRAIAAATPEGRLRVIELNRSRGSCRQAWRSSF